MARLRRRTTPSTSTAIVNTHPRLRLQPWVLDVARGQWSVDKVEQMIRDLGHADQERLGRPVPIVLERQIGTAQKHYERRWRKVLLRLAYHYADPIGKKGERADAVAARQKRGEVRLTAAPWNHAYRVELGLFPDHCRNDDQVDATAHAYNWLAAQADVGRGRGRPVAQRTV